MQMFVIRSLRGIASIETYFTMFNPRPVIVGFQVDKIVLMQVFFSTRVFACHCHPTVVPCSFIHLSPTLKSLINWTASLTNTVKEVCRILPVYVLICTMEKVLER